MRQDYDEAMTNVASLGIGCAGSILALAVVVAFVALHWMGWI